MRVQGLCVMGVATALTLAGGARSATTETGPAYDIQGRYYDTCACHVSCSCGANVTLPTEGHCDGIVLLHIDAGSVGAVGMGGLSLAIVLRSPGGKKVADALDTGDMDHLTVYIDDRATPEQRHVMPSLLMGLLGTKEVKGFKPPQFAPMTLSHDGDSARFQIAGGAKLSFDIENIDVEKARPGVAHSEGKRITLTNVAPFPWIKNVTQGYSKLFKYSDYGVNWEYKDRNAFFGTFATRGTSPAAPPPPR